MHSLPTILINVSLYASLVHLDYGYEVSDFRKCGSTAELFWLNGHPEQMKTIEELSLRQAEKIGEPYQEVYVRFSGFAEHREPVGFEEETGGANLHDTAF